MRRMRKPRRAVLWLGGLALAWLLTACPQAGNPPPPPQPSSGIAGRVVEYNAGPPVAGATVEVYKTGTPQQVGSGTTAADGTFNISLQAGKYDLRVSKPGYAGSQVLNVEVKAGATTSLAVIENKAFNPAWPVTPPQVTLVGVSEDAHYDAAQGAILYRVASQPAPPLATNIIYAALGKVPGAGFLTGTRAFFSQVDDTGDAYLNINDYAAVGPTTLAVVVYDTNGNRTELHRHIVIDVPNQGANPGPPQPRGILAVTLSKPVQFFNLRPAAAPAEGNLWVEVTWSQAASFGNVPPSVPHGYRIYRSFDGNHYTPIATVPATTLRYTDASPDLEVDRQVYYRVAAFVGSQESGLSGTLTTVPLPPFSVSLATPADNAQGVPTQPTFSWSPSQTVSAYHYYVGVIWDTLTGESAFFINNPDPALQNTTTWTWNEDGSFNGSPWEVLQKGRSYEWQIMEAYALDDPIHPTAVSVAADGLGLWFPFGVPSADQFTFTTAP